MGAPESGRRERESDINGKGNIKGHLSLPTLVGRLSHFSNRRYSAFQWGQVKKVFMHTLYFLSAHANKGDTKNIEMPIYRT